MLQHDEPNAQVRDDVLCWWAQGGSIKPISTASCGYHPPSPLNFTSLVINGLCQSSRVIGRTSSPVKRLISVLLCGWLKAMINNVMALLKICFSTVFRNQQCLVILIVFIVMYLSPYLTDMQKILSRVWSFPLFGTNIFNRDEIFTNKLKHCRFQQSYLYSLH